MVQVVVDDTRGAIDLVAGKVGLHHTRIAVEEALRISGRLVEERLSQQDLGKILPGVVAREQAAMKGAEQKIGAAGPNLSIAVNPGAVNVPVGSLTPNMIPVDMSLKKPVYMPIISMSPISLELNVAMPANASRVGGQAAIDSRYSHHNAPIAIEVVAEADIVPLRDYLFVRVEGRRGSGATDIVLCLIAAPVFKENPPAVVLLLRKIEATDVEYAATAGACERLSSL